MTPEASLEKQIECYRAMTGEQRLKIALDLHALSCNVARAGIRHQHPNASDEEVEQHLRRRIELSEESIEKRKYIEALAELNGQLPIGESSVL